MDSASKIAKLVVLLQNVIHVKVDLLKIRLINVYSVQINVLIVKVLLNAINVKLECNK